MDEQSIFLQALERDTPQERAKWLDGVCGRATPLRQRIDALLQRHFQASCFLEKPLMEVEGTINLSELHHPDGNHSVLKALRHMTGELSQVALREPMATGIDPIVKPASAEVPDRKNDSRYQLQGEIAQGGMGAIIRARDTDLGRDLAIKVLLERHKDKPEVIQRFVEEAQIGGQLQHPGIAPLYELGQFSDGRPFFSMKLVKGQTLSALLAERNDPLHDRGKLLGIFEQICQTMAYAHSRGVIHRDLKPANIMVGAFGEVQVMDWGLAKVLSTGGVADERKERTNQQDSIIETLRSVGSDTPEGSGSQTRVGSVMGTPAYMSPEQALGETDRLNERSDVFALGAILCVMLTGDPPYVGEDTTQVFRQATRGKLNDCFARLGACGADSALIDLGKNCLEVEPNDRPRDAGALAEQVASYLESVETRLREADLERAAEAARAEEERKLRRVTMALAASVLLSVVVAGGGWIYLDKQHSLQEQRSVERKDAAELAVKDSLREAEYHARLADAEDVGSEDAKVEIDKAVVLAKQAAKSAMQEDVDDLLRSRVDQTLNKLTKMRDNTQKELKEANTKRMFLTKLESIRLSQANQGQRIASDGDYLDSDTVDQDYEEAFRAAGFDLLNLEIPDAVALIQNSSMQEEIISSLDHWARWIPDTEDEDKFAGHVKAGDFAAAAKSAGRIVRQAPHNSELWLRLAPILVLRKDTAEYRKLCKRMVQAFASAEDVQTAERTCKACLLLPGAIDLSELPRSKLAAPLDEGTAPEWLQPWGWFARALLAYRSGDAESAMRFVKKSQGHNPNEFAAVLNLALSALAQHKLGRADDSRRNFDDASLAVHRFLGRGYHPGNYHDLMIAHLLLREASALLDRETPLESERFFSDRSSAMPIPLTRREKLLKVADESDTNEWRRSVRDALGNKYDIAEVKQMLSDDAEKFIASTSLIAWLGAVLRDEGELDTSIMVLRASQQEHPQDFWINYELAASLRINGDYAEAIEFARAALAVRPNSLEASVALAGALKSAGRSDDHLGMMRKLPRILLFENFQTPEIHVDALRRFCERFPADPRGHLSLSMALDYRTELVDEKLRTLKKAAQLNVEQLNLKDAKSLAWYPMQLGHNLKARGRVDDAAEAFRIAIRFNPPAVDWVNLKIFRAYARAERWADATAVNQQLIENNPEDILRWFIQATALILSGDKTSYREHCLRMVEHFPAAQGAGKAIATCKACCLLPDAIDLEQLPMEPLVRLLDQKPIGDKAWVLPWGWQARALVAYRKGDTEEALQYIQQSENSHPNDRAHAFNLVVRAMIQWKLTNVDEARLDVENASKAIDALPAADSGPINNDALMARFLLQEAKSHFAVDAAKRDRL